MSITNWDAVLYKFGKSDESNGDESVDDEESVNESIADELLINDPYSRVCFNGLPVLYRWCRYNNINIFFNNQSSFSLTSLLSLVSIF